MNLIRGNQSGQFIVEAVLLITLLLGATVATAKYFKDKSIVAQIISAPWKSLSGMIQNGMWAPPQASMEMHPNNHNRHTSLEGVAAK